MSKYRLSLLPNNVTVKLTLTSITDFNGWVKKHSEWMSYQQMWANYCVPMVPNVGLIPHPPNPIPATEVLPEIKKAGVVKVSNVDIKAFKNSDEIFKLLQTCLVQLKLQPLHQSIRIVLLLLFSRYRI